MKLAAAAIGQFVRVETRPELLIIQTDAFKRGIINQRK